MKYPFTSILIISIFIFPQVVFSIEEPPGESFGDLIQTQSFGESITQIAPTNANTYYLATFTRVYYSSNGKNWEIKNSTLPTVTKGLAVDSSGNLYLSGSNVYKSTNGGVTWNIMGQAEDLGSTGNLKVKVVKGIVYAWHPDQGLYYYEPSMGKWYLSINSSQYKVYDFMDVGEGVYYVGVQNNEVKFFHGLALKGSLPSGTIANSFPRILTYYDGAFYVILSKTTGGGAIYKSSDFGQTWTKVQDIDSDIPKSISSSIVNGIQVVTTAGYDTGVVWRSWSGSIWKKVGPPMGTGGDIISTNLAGQTIVASGSAIYTYDRNAFPILNLTEAYTIQKNQDLYLTVSATDLDGDAQFTYKWEKVSGPSTYTLLGNTAQIATFRATLDGIYSINVSVTDSSGGKSTKTVNITVGTGVSPPIAKVGQPPICHAGIDCYLAGWHTGTGTNITYQWTQKSGPQITWITNYSTTGSGSFIPSGLGTYNFTLTVRSNEGESTANLSVTVNNVAPIINLTATKTCIVQAPCKITAIVLNPDYDSQTFLWYTQPIHLDPKDSESNIEFIRGKDEEEVTISVRTKGSYTLYFSAWDGKVTSTKKVDIKSITETEYDKLQANNTAPLANAGQDQTARVNQPVNLDGSKSSDPENYTLSFLWRTVSGPEISINNATEAITIFTPTQAGTYIVQLTVTDVLGLTSNDTVQITVLSEEEPSPIVAIESLPTQPSPTVATGQVGENRPPVIQTKEAVEVIVGENVTLNSLAVDPEGQDVAYSWRQIGGVPVDLIGNDTANPSFIPPEKGLYTFELLVNDLANKQSMKRVTVLVKQTEEGFDLTSSQMLMIYGLILVIVVGIIVYYVKRNSGKKSRK